MKFELVLFLSRLFSLLLKLFGFTCSTWPGHLALKLDVKFLQTLLDRNPHLDIIIVAGTNGKTTTTKAIQTALIANGKRTLSNASGANLLNGLASSLLMATNIQGKIIYDVAVFEVDENTLPHVLANFSPRAIILLNLFRDQLDRYGEVNTIAQSWLSALKKYKYKSMLLVNGDDPLLFNLGLDLNAENFGLPLELMPLDKPGNEADSLYCPRCGDRLKYERVAYGHIGKFHCDKCGLQNNFNRPKLKIKTQLKGLYNQYNLTVAYLVLNKLYKINLSLFNKAMVDFTPAFGRQENIKYLNRKFTIILVKNPTGFNQGLEVIKELKPNIVLLLLNDRIPDGTDVSWIWDVNFEGNFDQLDKLIISGDRAYDLGIRLGYANISTQVIANYQEAIKQIIAHTSTEDKICVLTTYSAMLQVREVLTGRALIN